ncbi:MAG: hypothetical protein JSW53_01130 [Candidatus Bathyarchaeota archaeon]|nr:MAG: hypothetical protein JSW53_01130 [Candidatus Bathyarchaeota archaeon]
METIVILCGVNESGKSKTLKKFFGVSHLPRLRPMQLLERTLNGMKVYAVSLNSPQELRNFCDEEGVIDSIRKRITKCRQSSKGQQYTLTIPFGVYGAVKGKLNEDCILKPIEWLLDHARARVHVIYLQKRSARGLGLVEAFMKQLTQNVIESTEDYDRQSEELEDFIRRFLLGAETLQ